MKPLATLLLVVALALVVVFTWRGLRAAGPSIPLVERSSPSTSDDARGSDVPVALESPTSPTSRATASDVDAAATPATQAAETSPATPSPDTVKLRGAVVVIDENSVPNPSEDGTIELDVWHGSRATSVTTDVRAGRWEIDVVPGEKLSFDSATLRGRGAVEMPGRPSRVPFPADGVFDLTLRWPPPTILHVRDAYTGVDLESIEIVALMESNVTRQLVPATTQGKNTVTLHGNSPVALRLEDFAALPFVHTLHVRAPGYGWGATPFDPKTGGDAFVELEPGSDLDVDLAGDAPTSAVVVRLTRVGEDEPIVERGVGKKTRLSFESIPIGKFVVAAEIGEWFEAPVSLAKEEIELVAGGHAQVTLTLRAPKALETATLAGVVVVPREWEWKKATLSAQPLTAKGFARGNMVFAKVEPPSSSTGYDTYAWTMPAQPVGRYALTVIEAKYGVAVDLPVGGRSDVRIEVPAPVDVRVRVLDAQTRTVLKPRMVHWDGVQASVAGGATGVATYEGAMERYVFRAPLGDVVLSCAILDEGYSMARKTVSLQPGRNDVDLELERGCGVTLTVWDGEKALVLESGSDVSLEPLEGNGHVNSWQTGGEQIRLLVSKPGSYRLSFPKPLPGFVTPEPRVLDLQPGTLTPVDVRLVRKP